MKRLAFTLATVSMLLGASVAMASVEGKRIEHRPYADLNTPPEATTAAAGGLGVAATGEVKSRVRYEYTGGAPCGSPRRPDEKRTGGNSSNAESDGGGNEIWLLVGVGVGAVAVLGLVGFLFLRR
jgi:hypothetical protein